MLSLTGLLLIATIECASGRGRPGVPWFKGDIEHRRVLVGEEVSFNCAVGNLNGYKVAWIHKPRERILTVGEHIITHDPRFRITHDGRYTWTLALREVKKSDDGEYMCQVNTDPMISKSVHLVVDASPLVIEDDSTSHVGVTHSIGIFCTNNMDSRRWIWEREDGKPFSTAYSKTKSVQHYAWALSLSEVSAETAGNYLCHLNNTSPPVYRRTKLIVTGIETTTTKTVLADISDGECSHPQGKEGEHHTEGCLRKTCQAGVWKPSMEKTVCCFNNVAFQPSSTISTSSSPDGCLMTSIDCVLDGEIAKTELKVNNSCKGRSTAKQFDEIKDLLENYIGTKDRCIKKKVANIDTVKDALDLLDSVCWTDWLDRDNTTQQWFDMGDFEEFDEENTLDGFSGCNFQNLIRMRVVGQTEVFRTEAEVLAGTGDVVHVTSKGMYCKWTTGEQQDGKCEDYEVQLCCL